MMKIVFFFSVVTVFLNQGLAQKIFIKPYAGYSFQTQKDYYLVSSYYYNNDTIQNIFNNSFKFSLTQKINLGMSLGYNINNHFALGIQINYMNGSPNVIELFENKTHKNNVFENYKEEITIKGKLWGISPFVKMSKNTERFEFYLNFLLPLNNCSVTENLELRLLTNDKVLYPAISLQRKIEYLPKITAGFSSEFGIEYIFDKYFGFFIGGRYLLLYYFPDKSRMTEYFINGTDYLNDLDVNEKEFEYVNSYYAIDNNSPDSPSKKLKIKYSFCNINCILGVKLNL